MEEATWIQEFLGIEGHELFVEIEPEYLRDRFNLTGISTGDMRTQDVVDWVTGSAIDLDDSEDEGSAREMSQEAVARQFYGLVHARYIMDIRGQQKMLAKFVNGEFGRCPRALCRSQPVLPVGLHDKPNKSCVKLYCPKCEDVYHPSAPKQAALDGAYFGSSFPFMLFQSYPKHLPRRTSEQFVLKEFGFKLHEHAELARWQQKRREEMERKLRQAEA